MPKKTKKPKQSALRKFRVKPGSTRKINQQKILERLIGVHKSANVGWDQFIRILAEQNEVDLRKSSADQAQEDLMTAMAPYIELALAQVGILTGCKIQAGQDANTGVVTILIEAEPPENYKKKLH